MLETTSAPGNPGATISLKNEGPAFNVPPEATDVADATAAEKAETAQPAQKAEDPAQDPAAKSPDDKAAKTDEKEKPRSSVQQRIDELTRQKRDAERRAQQTLQELERIQAKLRDKESRVDPNDFAAVEQFRVEKAVAEGRYDDTAAEARRALDEAARSRAETFYTKVEAARASDPSIDQKLQQFSNVPVTEFSASFIAESEKAVEIAAQLGSNPDLARRIASLPEGQQGAELARLEAKLSAPPVKRVTQAPTPVPTLGGSRSPAVKDPSDMSVSEIAGMLYGKK